MISKKDKICAALKGRGIPHTAGDAFINLNDGTFGKIFLKHDGSPDGYSSTVKRSVIKIVEKAAVS